jgi:uncharacterized protein (TIGR02270 family)
MAFVAVPVPFLLEQHAGEAAFLWLARDRAVRSPAHDLDDLAGVDARLEAHLDGLRAGADVAWELALAELESLVEPGEAFVAAKLALDRGDMKGFARVLDQIEAEPILARALPSAIGFSPFDGVERVLRALTASGMPAPLRSMGLAGYAVHRRDPGAMLASALGDGDRGLRLRALKSAGELGARHLARELPQHFASADLDERLWAAHSAALLGDATGVTALQRVAEDADPVRAARAARLAGCLLDPDVAEIWIREIDAAGRRAAALAAAAASGQPTLVPWLLELMSDPEHARRAGHAFHAITGVAIAGALAAEPPPSPEDDDDLPDDPDELLPWPAPAAVAAADVPASGHLLLGRPRDLPWLEEVLRNGRQPERQLAAWLLAARRGGDMPFEVRAPAWEQRRRLSAGA